MEIAGILQRDLKDPRLGLATCTRVQVTGDLKVAKIYVSVLAREEKQKETMKALEGASGYVRRLLGQRLGLRASPEVRFIFDPSVEYGIKLEKLIEETKRAQPTEPEDDDS
jgi:ribosome-binding factor A